MIFFAVALGGALGAVGRYGISLIPLKTVFPYLTLVTNVIGAIVIGVIVGIVSNKGDVSPNTVLFWKTGVCGGFTTFSTFSLESLNLFENKMYFEGGLYIALSIICCLVGVAIGKNLAAWFCL